MPDGYTSVLPIKTAVFAIGNGWTVDVIAHIFKGLHTNAPTYVLPANEQLVETKDTGITAMPAPVTERKSSDIEVIVNALEIMQKQIEVIKQYFILRKEN